MILRRSRPGWEVEDLRRRVQKAAAARRKAAQGTAAPASGASVSSRCSAANDSTFGEAIGRRFGLRKKLGRPIGGRFAAPGRPERPIAKAVRYARRLVREPARTILVLISDFYEGGAESDLQRETQNPLHIPAS